MKRQPVEGRVPKLRRKQVLISVDQDRWLSNRARSEGRSESAVLRDLIDRQRRNRVNSSPDTLDAVVGAFKGRNLGTHDEILYGRRLEAKGRRAHS
jgi:hypothetical protein